jgi:phospholipid-binding lipoprotein MlaA
LGRGADDAVEYDPWEPFNETMFSFNRRVDRYVFKQIARVYDLLLPDPVQKGVRNMIDNIGVVPRLLNSFLQLKPGGATRELARFTINSTVGIGGLFDVAKHGLGIELSEEDTGQTFGFYGAGPGPYLVLPFLPVTTVRDGIGSAFDAGLNPLNYVLPPGAGVGIRGLNMVNERSLNLERFEQVEETVFDLYGAVRNGYLQRRARAIAE